MTIKKAKLKDDTLEVTYTKKEADGSITTVNESHAAKVHPDLKTAFQNLRIHLALLFGFVSLKQVKKIETPNEELIENFHVSAVSVKTGDDPGVVVTGHVITPFKKAGILNTPFTRFEEAEESAYKFTEDLRDKVDRALAEVHEYLNGKKADDPQQSLPFGEAVKTPVNNTDVEDAEILEETQGENLHSLPIEVEAEDDQVWAGGQRPKM